MTDNPANYTFESLPLDGLQQQDELDIGAELGIDANDTNYRIPVYQHGPKGLAWLFDYTLSDQVPLLERLRDEYGGGQFEIRVYKDSKIDKRLKLSVEAPKHKPPKADALSGTDVMGMIQRSQEQMLKQVEALLNRVQQPAAAPVDPMQLRRVH